MNVLFLLTPKAEVSYLFDTNTLKEGLEKIETDGFSSVPVISENGDFAGSVSEGDFLRYIAAHLNSIDICDENIHISDIISKNKSVSAVHIDANTDELTDTVMNQNFIPIVDGRNKFIGIITRKAVISSLIDKNKGIDHS
ncbi:MAG: CBS domain-containing protein [Oscillospiraceae bacterium]|nr:CBS domain-containing protein [Oscillospiraceae bacterium]